MLHCCVVARRTLRAGDERAVCPDRRAVVAIRECAWEHDVTDAMVAGRWPRACDRELVRHVQECATCGDLVDVATSLLHGDAELVRDVRLPSAAHVWWRAQLKARREKAIAAARPIAVAQAIAAATATGLTAAVIIWSWPGWGQLQGALDGHKALAVAAVGAVPPLALGGALLGVVLAPVALYWAFAE